jgi:hypothetical protein
MPAAGIEEIMKIVTKLLDLIFKRNKDTDFEKFGYDTILECWGDEGRARQICGCRIQACEFIVQPEIARKQSEIEQCRNHGAAFHSHLYDRPDPVRDAAMLTHRKKFRIFFAMALLAAIACFAGNTTTAYLFGFGALLMLVLAIAGTGLPLVTGYFAYERIIEKHKNIQIAIVAVAVMLGFSGIYQLAEARRLMVDRAAAAPATTSYVDDAAPAVVAVDQDARAGEDAEGRVRRKLSGAMLLIMLAADVMLGFVTGLLVKIHTDEDYASWRELQKIADVIAGLEESISRLLLSVEIAKRQCAAGILRAQVALSKRKPPYHRSFMGLLLIALLGAATVRAQDIERYDGILIDTSGSISKGGTTNKLFREYLVSTKKLLLTTTPSTRVWVSGIAVDSFGGDGTIVKGWTPEARGIFTDNLNRARRQLASAFEQKSSGLTPVAAGTDIFGALWRFKALFESAEKPDTMHPSAKTIWIFSDMMNVTNSFQMPMLLSFGPEQMLERAKANNLIIPLKGYKIYVYGATPNGLSPQAWLTVKNFWTLYFQAAGAELVTYSAECEAQR